MMVLFDTIVMTDRRETLTFAGINGDFMKYLLRRHGEMMATGHTDLKDSRGGLVDTNGCLVLFVAAGCAVATINFKRRPLRRGDCVLLFYDSTLSIEEASAAFSVRYASFAYALIEEAIYKPLSDSFWDFLYDDPVFRVSGAERELLEAWWRQLEWTAGMGEGAQREEMLKNSIRSLLIVADTEIVRALSDKKQDRERSHAWMLVTRFFHLVALHCHEVRDVRYYASHLSMTTTYLYKLCKKTVRLSPKEAIDKQTVTEIKTYLVNTDLSVKGIAAALNFEDVSYMCRYFRRMTGLSPQDYRKALERRSGSR